MFAFHRRKKWFIRINTVTKNPTGEERSAGCCENVNTTVDGMECLRRHQAKRTFLVSLKPPFHIRMKDN